MNTLIRTYKVIDRMTGESLIETPDVLSAKKVQVKYQGKKIETLILVQLINGRLKSLDQLAS